MMREPTKALPRRPWTIIAAAMIMDVLCIVVAVVMIWKGVGEICNGAGDVGQLGGTLIPLFNEGLLSVKRFGAGAR